jgi:roadblock/LC7 domain-containing protein
LSVPQVNAPAGSDLKVYPNPMNTNGTVDFALAKADNLTLTVYDIMGREVENMHLGTQATGEHLIPLNTSAYSAGTYIVSVTGNTYHKTGRFVVVK